MATVQYTPNPNPQTCTANLKNCPSKRGGCGYHYRKGDARWQDGGVCPVCGFSRRCTWPVRPDLNGGQTICRMHGKGSYRQGRVGRRPPKIDVPSNVLERAKARENDPTILEMRVQIAHLCNRAEEIMEKIDKGESDQAWRDLHRMLPTFVSQARQLWKNYQRSVSQAQANNTPETIGKMKDALFAIEDLLTGPDLDNLLAVIERGRNVTLANKEYIDTAVQALKLVEGQRKWELDKRYFISATEAMALPLRVYQLIEDTVMDKAVRNALVAGLELEVLRFQRTSDRPTTLESPPGGMLVDGSPPTPVNNRGQVGHEAQ